MAQGVLLSSHGFSLPPPQYTHASKLVIIHNGFIYYDQVEA